MWCYFDDIMQFSTLVYTMQRLHITIVSNQKYISYSIHLVHYNGIGIFQPFSDPTHFIINNYVQIIQFITIINIMYNRNISLTYSIIECNKINNMDNIEISSRPSIIC